MREPKITKLKGGYLADAELVFWSWWVDVLVHIQDHEIDNQAMIQLIKDQTQDSVHREVEFQLDLCGSDIPYKELLEHLSMGFQGGNDEANVLAEFYSHTQKPRESEEAFMDKLQLLAWKVISKKPKFQQNLNATLKQHYANQLFDHNNASIVKTLLLQMPKVTFTQFHNELARVLGTHQCSKPSTKVVSVSTVESNLGNDVASSKNQQKCQKKMNAQSSQILDLRSKLDAAMAENAQVQELLNPSTLQTVVTSTLQVAQLGECSQSGIGRQSKPFLGKPQEPQLAVGKDGPIDPDKTCQYCKDTRHEIDNCKCLQYKQDLLASKKSGGQTGAPTSVGLRVGATKNGPAILDSQFDDILKTLVNNAISLETKQFIMQRAMSGYPKVTLDVMGKGVPSLLDSGSMVNLIQEGYFEKNILPLLKASLGKLSEAHSLFKLSAANNSTMPVLRYFEADIKLLDFPVP